MNIIRPPLRRQQRVKSSDKAAAPSTNDFHPASPVSGHVIIVGPKNSGKTKTLKTLFKSRISPQNTHPNTTHVTEFGLGTLRLIDTPGLGHSTESDSSVIATLKKFLDTDPILRDSIPNAVLLVTKFNDPGITSSQSAFVKTLRALNLLSRRLISKNYCNLIVLLTHFMNMRRWVREDPRVSTQIVRDLVRQHLSTSCHIIVGENDCEGWGLPRMTLGHRLPTGDIYPGNLIDLLVEVMRQSGYTTMAFQDGQFLQLVKSWPLVGQGSTRYSKALEALNWANGLITVTI